MMDISDQDRSSYAAIDRHGFEVSAQSDDRPDEDLSMSGRRILASPLPIELSFATKTYRDLDVRLDPAQKALWYFMKPTEAPSYTPSLLSDLRDMSNQLKLFMSRAAPERPVQYLVIGSKLPNIFNLGGDLGYFAKHIRARDREGLRQYARACVDLVYSSYMSFDLPIVLISVVQGDALGGGFEAAMASDIIIAERSAKFGLPEILFNLFPGMGAYSFLSRRLDPVRASQMIMSGRIYSADELHAMGLVDLVVEDGTGQQAAKEYINRNNRKHSIYRTLRDVRRRVNPLAYEELIDVVDLWVDAAMELEESDLRKIDRLRIAQAKRIGAAVD
ncbi:crotonase/enoyl-CoA hydratase family protein [Rhizobium oryzicola]|uniref:Crotonase/enoyl-CoA hydratase family protein n=1 Tax=Rhizobium oryzicola TaxID=1232668 RepID=A0ABT8T220_9HYPH|nr:crotonase/enoyl-CoA hydratase family protein [Rhizobium oryzicola]MDO1584799.1 crotonase/enoyl-CoA hydratase family protein [Rhizobium oryzicola]